MHSEILFECKNGKKVLIRTPKESDVNELLSYANRLSAEDTFVSLSGEQVNMDEESAYLSEILRETKEGIKFQLFAFFKNSLIATADIRRITKYRRRQKHVGVLSISVDKDWRGRGLGHELIAQLISQAKSMNIRLLTLTAFSVNASAIALYKKLGFTLVGAIPSAIWYKGGYVDEISMFLEITDNKQN